MKNRLNTYIRQLQHITENELVIIHGNQDVILSFLLILVIGHGVHDKMQSEVDKLIWNNTNEIVSPLTDGILIKKQPKIDI